MAQGLVEQNGGYAVFTPLINTEGYTSITMDIVIATYTSGMSNAIYGGQASVISLGLLTEEEFQNLGEEAEYTDFETVGSYSGLESGTTTIDLADYQGNYYMVVITEVSCLWTISYYGSSIYMTWNQ